MLPPEAIENNRRYARLLLAGKIQFPVPGEMPTDTRWHEESSLTAAPSQPADSVSEDRPQGCVRKMTG
ncbi:MAG: hypothetical protein ACXW32_10575 [Limisphaerales bacterium]